MSHNEISFSGILQPIADLLSRNPKQSGKLTGQEVVVSRKDVQAILALDNEDNTHLLIIPAPSDSSLFSEFELKGLKISVNEWAVAGHVAQNYLDISCATGTLPSFRRPFLRFAEDVLFEISRSKMSPADAAHRTCIRWKKFWSPDTVTEVTQEWIRGLFGELLFLTDLIERFGSGVIDSWAGPAGKDHDFQTGNNIAAEVKTSVEVPFRINCNLRQLDSSLFKLLYVVCYHLTPSEKGITLPDLVKNVEQLLEKDQTSLDKFYDRLITVGYIRHLEPVYSGSKIEYTNASVFKVDDNFPKIIESSFVNSPDHRISGIRYTLQITGIDELTIDSILDKLAYFSKQN